jgi:hypothetical protein
MNMTIKVRAKQLGYYDHLRRKEGIEFSIAKPEHFSERWMEKIDPSAAPTPAPAPAPAAEAAPAPTRAPEAAPAPQKQRDRR